MAWLTLFDSEPDPADSALDHAVRLWALTNRVDYVYKHAGEFAAEEYGVEETPCVRYFDQIDGRPRREAYGASAIQSLLAVIQPR